MEAMIVFGVIGAFSMSAAMFTSQLLKLPADDRPDWLTQKSGQVRVMVLGNLAAIIFVATMVFGFYHFVWWLPLACAFISFPVIQVMFLERLLSPAKGLVLSAAIAILASPLLWFYW